MVKRQKERAHQRASTTGDIRNFSVALGVLLLRTGADKVLQEMAEEEKMGLKLVSNNARPNRPSAPRR